MTMKKKMRYALQFSALMLAIALLGSLTPGCGSEEPAPAPEAVPAVVAKEAAPAAAETAAPAPVEEAPKAAVNADKALVLEALAFMPEKAQIAIAAPPVNGILAKLIPFAKRVAPEGIDIEEEIADITTDLAEDAGVDDAETLNDIALAKGLSLDAPIALFTDLTPSSESIRALLEEAQAEASDDAAESPEAPEIEMDDLESPAWAAVVGISDAAKAEASLMEVVEDIPELRDNAKDELEVEGIAIKVYGDYGYFLTDRFAVLGSLAMVEGAAKRVAAPATFRYGTEACPVSANDEMAMLVYYDRLMPLLEGVMPALGSIEDLPAPFIEMQMNMMKAALKSEGEDDPGVMTLAWTDESLELKFRMDSETHPGLIEYSGQGNPFKLSQTLPENTVALISLCLNEQMKKQITENYMAAIPPKMKEDAGFAQGVTIAQQVIGLLGEEVTLAIAAAEEDLPGLFLLLQLADPEATKGMLQMLVPTAEGETYNEVDIRTIQLPIPVPLYMALVNDLAFVSTDLVRMKAMIDRMKAGESSTFFASQEPPFAPDTPRYSTVLLKTSLVDDVVLPLSMLLGGGIPEEAQPIVEQVVSVARELRAVQSQEGSWMNSSVSIYINPEEK